MLQRKDDRNGSKLNKTAPGRILLGLRWTQWQRSTSMFLQGNGIVTDAAQLQRCRCGRWLTQLSLHEHLCH